MNMTRKNFFIGSLASLAAGAVMPGMAQDKKNVIQGFDEFGVKTDAKWTPFSDKKVRVGIAGFGVCHFGAQFFFQDHPNVEVVAAADLFKDRAEALAKQTKAKRVYLSAEEMIDKEKGNMDAVFIATDAASHADLVIRALDRGYHVASAVPALLGEKQLDRAEKLMEAVKKSGKVYALYETTAFRAETVAMRRLYKAGAFGTMVYTEGEYFHWGKSDGSRGAYADDLSAIHIYNNWTPMSFPKVQLVSQTLNRERVAGGAWAMWGDYSFMSDPGLCGRDLLARIYTNNAVIAQKTWRATAKHSNLFLKDLAAVGCPIDVNVPTWEQTWTASSKTSVLAAGPESTIYAVSPVNCNVGFWREGAHYTFDYKIPEGQSIQLTIKTGNRQTRLFADGKEVGGAPRRQYWPEACKYYTLPKPE